MDRTAYPFLSEIHRRTDGRPVAPKEVRDAVRVLTAAADPARADRLAPRPSEPASLVARLAVWALHQVGPDVIAAADAVLRAPSPSIGRGAAEPIQPLRAA